MSVLLMFSLINYHIYTYHEKKMKRHSNHYSINYYSFYL